MAKLGIDLSKFRKIAHDKDTATLRHKDGHEIKIALKGLHPSSRGDVARLPLHEAPKKMADGGQVDAEPLQAEAIEPQVATQPEVDYNNQPPLPAGTPPSSVDGAPAMMPSATPDTSVPAEPLVPQQSPLEQVSESEYGKQFGKGIEQEVHGREQLAVEQAKMGQEQAMAEHHVASQLNALQQQSQQASEAHTREMEAVIEDAKNGHINPNQFIENKDLPNKITTMIGLIMGGYGSGVQGKENPALKFLNDQIDHDIEAQKANISNKYNLVNAYSKQYGDKVLGAEAAKNLMLASAMSKMKEAEAKAIGPQAKANLQMQLGQLATQYGTSMAKFGMQDAFYKMGAFDKPGQAGAAEQLIQQANKFDPKLGEQMQKHYVPGVGVSVQEVPEKAREQIKNGNDALSQVARLREFSSKNHGLLSSFSPSPKAMAIRAQGQTMVDTLLNTIRTAKDMGVYKQSAAEFEAHLLGRDPLSAFAKFTQEPKYKEVETSLVNEYNNLLSSHGLHAAKVVSQPEPMKQELDHSAAEAFAKAHPEHPVSKAYLKKRSLTQ